MLQGFRALPQTLTLALPCAQVRDSVAIHVPCSSKKMGIASAFETVAGKCAHEVVPTGVPCCGAPIRPKLHGPSSLTAARHA